MKLFKCGLVLKCAHFLFMRDVANVQQSAARIVAADVWRDLRVARLMHVTNSDSLRGYGTHARGRASEILIVLVHCKRSFIRPNAMSLHRYGYLRIRGRFRIRCK